MAQFSTKIPANVGTGSPSAGGNQGFTQKYYPFTWTTTLSAASSSGTPVALTAQPLGVAPCKCTYVGYSVYNGAGTAGTATVTYSPLKIPFDTGTGVALNSTDTLMGTTIVAYPAVCTSVNFDSQGQTTTRGSNATTTTTGITAPVFKTDSSIQFRQGDIVALTTAGTFTGLTTSSVTIWLREDNGAY